MTIKTVLVPAGGGFDNVRVGTSAAVDPGPGDITVRLRELGADEVINYREDPEHGARNGGQ